MFDVVPPNAEEFDREEGLGASRRRGFVKGKPRASHWRDRKYGDGDLSKRTVEVEWKLPARLRKPVREQLQKERAQRKRRKSVIQFDRRPIRTQVVGSVSSARSVERDNRGAEKHMGDTYRHTKPNVQVAVPPYQGKALSRRLDRRTPGVKTDTMRRRPRMQQSRKQKVEARQTGPTSLKLRGAGRRAAQSGQSWVGGERDMPFDWKEKTGDNPAAATKPLMSERGAKESTLTFPFTFSFWPRSLVQHLSKKKLAVGANKSNLVILLLGLGVAWGVVWNLQGAGRGLAVLGGVQDQAEAAVRELVAAQSALAEADLDGSEASLAEAERLLSQARSDVDEAVQAAQVVLRYVDVTGRVRSGDALLTAGQELTGAGKRIVKGLQYLQSTEAIVPEELLGGVEAESQATLVDGIVAAQAEFEQALVQIERADAALADVKLSVLPEEIQPSVEQLLVVTPRIEEVLGALTAQSDTILYLLGASADRQYLLAFANNHELRPIGGFVGTVGLVNMDRGRVEQIDIGSVYHRDGQLRDFIAPPEPLKKIVDRWYLRDTNWFVNYPVSARKMAEFLEKEGGPTVDGVMLMTPQVIERLLRLTGPVVVPGYEVVVTADTFRTIAQSEVTYDYDPELNRPKQFLADLTPLLLQKVMSGGDEEVAGGGQLKLLAALTEAISQKELLVYFQEDKAQQSLVELGWDGSLPEDKQGFLAVNTANIGGHKSDQFIKQEVDYRSQLQKGGQVEVTVTIRREHKGPEADLAIDYPAGENPAEKDNVVYQRVFVPKGAELLEASGFTSEAEVPQRVVADPRLPLRLDTELAAWQGTQVEDNGGTVIGEEAGYQYFANWLITQPGQTTVGLYRYRLPEVGLPAWWDRASSYQTYVYKQPGDELTDIRASIEVPEGFEITHSVPGSGITQQERSSVYRGALRRDVVMGVVIEPGS